MRGEVNRCSEEVWSEEAKRLKGRRRGRKIAQGSKVKAESKNGGARRPGGEEK
jgi:hypothetical protein